MLLFVLANLLKALKSLFRELQGQKNSASTALLLQLRVTAPFPSPKRLSNKARLRTIMCSSPKKSHLRKKYPNHRVGVSFFFHPLL